MTKSTDLRLKTNEQYQFDKIIGDTDVSGLSFLKDKYKDDIVEYSLTHDLNNPDYFREYKGIQERYKMINKELSHRATWTEEDTMYGKEPHFNDNYDIVIKEETGEIRVVHPFLTCDGEVDSIELDEDEVRD